MSKKKINEKPTPNLKRVVSYARVSTTNQLLDASGAIKEDSSPDAQKNRCLSHVKNLELQSNVPHVLVKHISDDGYSGKNTNRPGYQEMWDLITSGAVDIILATELSRLSRSVKDFLELISHCKDNNVDVVIIGLSLDTSTPGGRMMLLILIGMAQFEREMTSDRVSKNALSRLIEYGKINGSSEVLGLDCDINKRGHFVANAKELGDVKKILNHYIKSSSRSKTLELSKKMGLKGKHNKELTMRTIDTILENTRWRYRGVWYLNKENEGNTQPILAESKRFREIPLPHGQLIESELLNQVQEKIKLNFDKTRRTGIKEYTYLLSHLMFYEDDTRFTGASAKSGANRYYYNYRHKMRIPCVEVDNIILARFKIYLQNSFKFETLLEQGLRRREADMPKLNQELTKVITELDELKQKESSLSEQLSKPENSGSPSFMSWLKKEVEACADIKNQLNNRLLQLESLKYDVLEKSGLDDVKKSVTKYIEVFDDLSGTQKRDLLERFVKRVTITSDKKLEIQLYWGSGAAVTPRKKSSTSKENGGVNGTSLELFYAMPPNFIYSFHLLIFSSSNEADLILCTICELEIVCL